MLVFQEIDVLLRLFDAFGQPFRMSKIMVTSSPKVGSFIPFRFFDAFRDVAEIDALGLEVIREIYSGIPCVASIEVIVEQKEVGNIL